MSELSFNEYWIVILNRNPDYDTESPEHKELMRQHFEFIDEQVETGNLFAAVPMSSGGLYIFDGNLNEEFMHELLSNEGSIKGGVFISDLRKGYVPGHHIIFILEEKKRIDEFQEKRKQLTNN